MLSAVHLPSKAAAMCPACPHLPTRDRDRKQERRCCVLMPSTPLASPRVINTAASAISPTASSSAGDAGCCCDHPSHVAGSRRRRCRTTTSPWHCPMGGYECGPSRQH
jgi:hypothetical protein